MVIAGPTGVGKSQFAVELAERLGAEILGADAFQIYRGLPLLTAQPSLVQRSRVHHHLVGVLEPEESCDAARYASLAQESLKDLKDRQHSALLVGGTGLYLSAALCGLDAPPPSDPVLREEFQALSLAELIERLHRADPDAASRIDMKNPRRVQRALEIVLTTGAPLAHSRQNSGRKQLRGLLLVREREELRERIRHNVESMFTQGVAAEVAALRHQVTGGLAQAIGFSEICQMLDGQLSENEAREQIINRTRQYAKRQLTWFRGQTTLTEVNLSRNPNSNQALDSALEFIAGGCE